MEKSSSRPFDTPRRAFRSVFYWGFCETVGGTCFRVGCTLLVASIWFLCKKFDDPRFDIACVISVVLSSMMILASYPLLTSKKEYLAECHLDLITAELQKTRPGVSEEAWDQVASELNDLFYQMRIWRTPYFFYNGQYCQSCFRKFYLRPFYNKSSKNSTDATDLEKGPNVAEDTDSDQESAKKRCVIEYKDSMQLFFDEFVLQEPEQISSEFAVLPKELYNKFLFNIRCLKTFRALDMYWKVVHFFLVFRSLIPLWVNSVVLAFLLLAAGGAAYIEYPTRKFGELNVPDRIRILAEVMRTKPKHSDIQAWETLAKGANQWLRAKGTWKKSDEFFFDGEEYEKLYLDITSGASETYVELSALAQGVWTAVKGA